MLPARLRYKELQNEIQGEEGITNSGFIRIDSSPLKQALTGHCNGWQVMFTNLLNENAYANLSSIYNHMNKIGSTFKKKPLNLDQLAEQIGVLRGEQAEIEKNEARFEPLQEQYAAPSHARSATARGRSSRGSGNGRSPKVALIIRARRALFLAQRPHPPCAHPLAASPPAP